MRVGDAALGPSRQVLLAMPWGLAQDGLQRAATRLGAERGTPWVGVCNGRTWRWYDATRPYAREHVGIDLTQASIDARVWQALWLLGQRARSTRQLARAGRRVDRTAGGIEHRRRHGRGCGPARRRVGDAGASWRVQARAITTRT